MAKKQSANERIELQAEPRVIFGKKLAGLRRQHILPGNIYAEDMESKAVQIALKDFTTVYKKAHETHIVYLMLEGKEYPILIQNVQKHPVTDILLHVDLRKVNLAKKLEAQVPVKIIGESVAITQGNGVLLTLEETVLVEALPADLPSEIEIDISTLKDINEEINVGSLKTSGKFIFKDDPAKVIVRISEHKEEDTTSQIASPESVEVTGEKKETEEGAEGAEEAPPAEEVKEEKKSE